MFHESLQPRRAFLVRMGVLVPTAVLGFPWEIANGAGRKAKKPTAKPKPVNTPDAVESPSPQSSKPSGPVDPENLKLAQFQPLLNQEFKLAGPNDRTVPLILASVKDLTRDKEKDKARPSDVRSDPFLLVFLAKEFDTLPAKIYRISNPQLGEFDVYLNEVRADDDPATVHYCVVFN
jgi:hypothetical protein